MNSNVTFGMSVVALDLSTNWADLLVNECSPFPTIGTKTNFEITKIGSLFLILEKSIDSTTRRVVADDKPESFFG